MKENPAPAGTPVYVRTESSIFENPYEREVQLDIWQHEKKKTMLSLFGIGTVLLIGNLISYASVNLLDVEHLASIGLYPVVFFGLGFFAQLQPMIAAIGGIVVVIVITVLGYVAFGPASLISGWLFKTIALYFIITSVRHAKEAEDAKKKLGELG